MKLSALIITKDERNFFLKDCIESALGICDEVIIVDGGSNDTYFISEHFPQNNVKVIFKKWSCPESYTNQRNYGLQFCKGDYVLNLDADEILGDEKYLIKQFISDNPDVDCFDIQGVHFIYNLKMIDATLDKHVWLNRIFKNADFIRYPPNRMHGLAIGWKSKKLIPGVHIFHLGYVKHLIKKMISIEETNSERREMHPVEYLRWYRKTMLSGNYPVREFDLKYPNKLKEWLS